MSVEHGHYLRRKHATQNHWHRNFKTWREETKEGIIFDPNQKNPYYDPNSLTENYKGTSLFC